MSNENLSQPRVVEITVGRLFNLGNYENKKVEIKIALPEGVLAGAVLRNTEQLVEALRPIGEESWEITEARRLLQTKAAELNESKFSQCEEARQLVEQWELQKKRHDAAYEEFDRLGGSIKESGGEPLSEEEP